MHKKLFFIGTLLMICSHKSLSMDVPKNENHDNPVATPLNTGTNDKIEELLNTPMTGTIKQMVLLKNQLFFLYKDLYSVGTIDLDTKPLQYKSCTFRGTSLILNWQLGLDKNQKIYHLAEPYDYKGSLVLPIANKNNVFLAEIAGDYYNQLKFNVIKKIITHSTDIFKLFSCGKSIISSSIYPSTKIWQYDKELETATEFSYVGGICLGSNNNDSFFYMIRDTYPSTISGKWSRWHNSKNKEKINGYLHRFNLKLDADKKLKLNETKVKEQELNLNLNNPENILFATYTKTEPSIKQLKGSPKIDIDGMLLDNKNNFYLCGTHRHDSTQYFTRLTLSDKSTISQDVKQMLFFAYHQENKNNFYLVTMADTNIEIYSLIDLNTKHSLIEDKIRNNTTILLDSIKTIPANDTVTKFQRMTFDKAKNILYIAANNNNNNNETTIYKIENFISEQK